MNQQQSQSDSLLESLGQVYEYTKTYIDVKVDQGKLELVEKSSMTLSLLITLITIGIAVATAIFFLLVALAFVIAHWTGSYAAGFAIVAGLVLVVTSAIYIFRKNLVTNPIIEMIIKNIYD